MPFNGIGKQKDIKYSENKVYMRNVPGVGSGKNAMSEQTMILVIDVQKHCS